MLTGSYNYGLVALSWVVAVLAAYTAIELTRVVAQRKGRAAIAWLIAGSLALGVGIWTMHFVGMLAFRIRVPFSYDWLMIALSMVIAVTMSAFVVWQTSRKVSAPVAIGTSGIALGTGIAAMHYTGMGAIQMAGTISHEPTIVAASIGIGIIGAIAAIAIIHNIVHTNAQGPSSIGFKGVAAMVMGLAICGVHYTGMAAARYAAHPDVALLDAPASDTSLSVVVALAALLILGVTQLTVFFDLRIEAEQRRNREAQRRALHLNELLDYSSNEILVVDLESLGIVNANRRCCENLGYTLAELTYMSIVDIIENAAERSFREHIASLVENDEEHLFTESTRVRADGSVYPVQVNLQFSNLDGAPYLLVFATDITARKSLQQQLDVAQEYESIGRLTSGVVQEISGPAVHIADNLRFLQEAMSEALELIVALSGIHLAASRGQLTPERIEEVGDMLKTVDPCYLADEIPLALNRSLHAVSCISAITRALKDFSHPDSNARELTDINKSVQNTILVASSEWKYLAALETDLDPDLPLVPCKSREIGHALLMLIVNAANAIEERLRANPDAPTRIDISTRNLGETVEIAVSDTGAGIPSNIGRRIFDPGFTTRNDDEVGGQGLTIAQDAIVEGHGGSIDFTSVEGEGTTFTIRLPVEAARRLTPTAANVAA